LAVGELTEAELKAQRKELDALAKELNWEVAKLVKSAYAMFDEAQTPTKKAGHQRVTRGYK
jgi:hypothetical protein